jgi:hypothetical protein
MRGDITFIKGNGTSKRVGAGEDFISGLILYTGSLPSGFTTVNNTKALYSIVDAVNAGIKSDYSDETKAAGAVVITGAGTNGDTINIVVSEPLGVIVDLGTYKKVTGDTTPTKVGDAITAIINAGTKNHGYTALNTTGSVAITPRAGLGIFLNSGTPIIVTLSAGATMTNTITQFSGGVASKQAVWHYHIAEYFRGNPNSILWVGFFPVPSPYTFAEITLLQTAAAGKLRQVGIFKDSAAYASGDLTAIDGIIKTYNDARHKPLSALYAADLKATTDITTIPDLTVLQANKVSSIIGQDGAALGAYLYAVTGKSVTQLGIALGMLSLSAVSEDFGQPAKFNLSNGTENDVPAFANGQLLSDPALSDAALDAIDANRHIFGQKYGGYAGTFFNDNHCAVALSSDYAFINDNRVIDKAIRGIYTALVPYLKSKIIKNSDGTLADTAIAFFEGVAIQPLYQMARDQDLGAVSDSDVYIDPTQNVSTTSLLIINVKLNENGIARNIQVPISFK